MAYFTKVPTGWRVQIERDGVRRSKTFPHKATAQQWAAEQENAIISGTVGKWPAKTLTQAIDRYEREVSAHKRGKDFESKKFRALERDYPVLCGMTLATIKTPDLVAWRDKRLKVVTKGSVQREINLLRNLWTVASKEWHWCGESPWLALKMPGDNPPRTHLPTWRQIKQLVRWLGYRTGRRPATKYQEVAWALMIGLRSGMRAGEVLSLTAQSVDLVRKTAHLGTHKTLERDGARVVPLPRAAVRLLGVLMAGVTASPWTISSASLDALFRKARDANLLTGLHFHDSRAMALTMLARKFDVMTLARISGHRDLNLLLRTYYRETPEQIAARI